MSPLATHSKTNLLDLTNRLDYEFYLLCAILEECDVLVPPMHLDILHAPQVFTSLPTMIPFPQTIKLQLLFYSIIS